MGRQNEETMIKLFVLVIVLVAVAALTPHLLALDVATESPSEVAVIDQRVAVKEAVYWMVREFQNDDGGYALFSSGANQAESSVAGTLDAVLALAAAGYNPAARHPGEPAAPIDYLSEHIADVIAFAEANGGQAGKVVMALTASTIDPRSFGGHDFVATLTGHLEPSGAYGVADPFKQAVAILGVVAAGEDVPAAAVGWLGGLQESGASGGDAFAPGDGAAAAAMAVMSLLAAGRTTASPSVLAAREFFADTQLAGGWAYGPGLSAGANSTAFVVQALSAMGEEWYTTSGPWVVEGQSPLAALMSYRSETGAFQSDFGQGPFDDFYATVQAIPAAAGRPFPLPARLESARTALSCLDTLQDPATGGWASFAGSTVDAAGTSRAIQAIAALGESPRSERWTTPGGADAVAALEELTPVYLDGGQGGRVGIVMQGVVAAGPPEHVSNFAGETLPVLMSGFLSPTGEYDSIAFGIFAQAEAMLGLIRAGEPVAPAAVDLLNSVHSGGDWGDPDSNGIVLQVYGGLSRPARAGTLAALRAAQTPDGGWGFGGNTSASTSSEVVQGLTAVELNPFAPDWSRVVDGQIVNAADAVMTQQADDGCWPSPVGPDADPYSTTDAVLLLTQRPGWGFSAVRMPIISAGP